MLKNTKELIVHIKTCHTEFAPSVQKRIKGGTGKWNQHLCKQKEQKSKKTKDNQDESQKSTDIGGDNNEVGKSNEKEDHGVTEKEQLKLKLSM